MSAMGGKVNKYGLGDYLKKYFSGVTFTDLVNKVYEANKDKLGDKETWIRENGNPATWTDEEKYLPLLYNAWYQDNPEARNSQVKWDFSPVSTWNPLNIGVRADEGYTYPGDPDRYRAIKESDFINDPAYKQLTDEQKKLKGAELAKALEGTKAYNDFRDYLKGNESEALKWLGNLAEHGSTYAANRIKYDKEGDGDYKWADGYSFDDFENMLKDISYDADTNPNALSVGHLTTTPQTEWQNRYFLKNSDGSYT